eukprot:TRINITY_DN4480_c1_g1_i3.p1 TRINITY_DN4480_c1_g1~~TRINITY_DN4480_c1_g1_i3.p1  ORF type:complete len:435 (-),score=120.38 TRINITY_DN4480_c1_g1_i3:223-1527(-)
MDGDLMKVCRKTDKSFHFFLFSDLFLYAGKGTRPGSYVLHRQFPINAGFVVVDAPDHAQPAFQIRHAQKSFTVYAKDNEEKKKWFDALTDCINECQKMNAISQAESGEAAPLWTPDKNSKNCEVDQKPFSLVNRRHHCRRCGRLVCSSCSKARMRVGANEKVRVCDICVTELKDKGTETPSSRYGKAQRVKIFKGGIEDELAGALSRMNESKASIYDSDDDSKSSKPNFTRPSSKAEGDSDTDDDDEDETTSTTSKYQPKSMELPPPRLDRASANFEQSTQSSRNLSPPASTPAVAVTSTNNLRINPKESALGNGRVTRSTRDNSPSPMAIEANSDDSLPVRHPKPSAPPRRPIPASPSSGNNLASTSTNLGASSTSPLGQLRSPTAQKSVTKTMTAISAYEGKEEEFRLAYQKGDEVKVLMKVCCSHFADEMI